MSYVRVILYNHPNPASLIFSPLLLHHVNTPAAVILAGMSTMASAK